MTRTGKRIHYAFICAGIILGYLVFVPMSWPRYLTLVAALVTAITLGVLGAVMAAVWDFLTGRRHNRWRDDYPPYSARWGRHEDMSGRWK